METVYSGADWNPGANAGYRQGRNQMRLCVCHETIGVDSTPIGLNGYFHFLISRGGHVQQFAELDAITWHAGEANGFGPGIEVEYLPGTDATVFTDPQRAACKLLIEWVSAQGIPLTYYDGPRVDPAGVTGFISHRSIIQTAEHYDWWPQEDWDAMVATPVPPTPPEEDDMQLLYTTNIVAGPNYVYVPGVGMVLVENTDGPFQKYQISQADFDRMNKPHP